MGNVQTLTLSGSPRERGLQHGRALKDGVQRFYNNWMSRSMSEPSLRLTETDLMGFAAKHAGYVKHFAPDLYEELQGIAEGAELSFEQVLFANCFDEGLDSLSIPRLGAQLAGMALPPPVTPMQGCTSFAAFAPATSDGKTYIGQGYDVGATYYEPVVFRIMPYGDEPEQLVYSHAGVLGVSGVNAAGLGIVENSLKPSDQQPGAPYPVVVRKALQQTVLSDFVGSILMAPRACGQNYVIGSPFGAVNIETSAKEYSFRYLQDGVFGHANHYEEPEMKHLELWLEWLPDTLVRSGRMTQILKSQYGQIDLEVAKEIMRDHANYPNSICRHPDSHTGVYSTLSALIYRPEDRLMLVSDGCPCCSPYLEFSI
jgi:isopenicillin-N N-acyltransferase like protein